MMPGLSYSTLVLLCVISAFFTCGSCGAIVDNSTSCDYFATRTTINATHDECVCGDDFTGNGTYCGLLARLDCTSDVTTSGYAFKVYLNQTYIDYMGISTSQLRLLNESCNNVTNEGGYYVLYSPEYDDCGSTMSNSSANSSIIYSNAVLTNGGGISSGNVLRLDFTCFVTSFLSISLSNDNGSVAILTNRVGSQTVTLPVQGGTGTVTASMFLYRDASYSQAYNGVPVLSTNEMLYVKIALDTVLNGVYIIARQCWATPDAAGGSSERFDIIEQPGCLRSGVTNGLLSSNGIEEEARFQLPVFTFLPTSVVYIHCQVELCTAANGATCQPTCPANRRKRDITITTVLRSSLIIKSSDKIDDPYETPGSHDDPNQPEEKTDKMLLLAILVALLVLMIIVVTAVFCYLWFVRRKKHPKGAAKNLTSVHT